MAYLSSLFKLKNMTLFYYTIIYYKTLYNFYYVIAHFCCCSFITIKENLN